MGFKKKAFLLSWTSAKISHRIKVNILVVAVHKGENCAKLTESQNKKRISFLLLWLLGSNGLYAKGNVCHGLARKLSGFLQCFNGLQMCTTLTLLNSSLQSLQKCFPFLLFHFFHGLHLDSNQPQVLMFVLTVAEWEAALTDKQPRRILPRAIRLLNTKTKERRWVGGYEGWTEWYLTHERTFDLCTLQFCISLLKNLSTTRSCHLLYCYLSWRTFSAATNSTTSS